MSKTAVSERRRAFSRAAAPVAGTPEKKAEMLARRLCAELQALTGNANTAVLLDTLVIRLRTGYRELEPAVAFGAARGWIELRADSVALREQGRTATRTPWPPAEIL